MPAKSLVNMMPQSVTRLPAAHRTLTIPTPPVMVPPMFQTPRTTWGAKRQAKYYRALTDVTNAQSGYMRARTELTHAFIGAARAAHELSELPEICAFDSEIRELHRERDWVRARRELEEERYGLYATQNEVDKLRRPRLRKAAGNVAAIDALLKTKVDMEAMGEDTSDIDQSLVALQRSQA